MAKIFNCFIMGVVIKLKIVNVIIVILVIKTITKIKQFIMTKFIILRLTKSYFSHYLDFN